MGRGLGKLQLDILRALEDYPRVRREGAVPSAARPRDLLTDLGREPTPANRVAMSRALGRLVERGLVEAWRAACHMPGKGSKYLLPGRGESLIN